MGPWFGWIGGWAIFTTGVLVVGSLADVSAFYIYRLLDLETLKNSREAVVILAIVIIVIMTAICVIGTELSARVQRVMVLAQVGALVLLVVVGAIQLIFGGAPETSIPVSLSWLNPFDAPSYSALLSALLAWCLHLLGVGERGQPHRGDRGRLDGRPAWPASSAC